MNPSITSILIDVSITLILAIMLFPVIIRFMIKKNIVDRPDHRKIHQGLVPAAGGITIFISILLTSIFSQYLASFFIHNLSICISIFILFIVGVWDDQKNISPKFRLIVQLLCAIWVASSGTRITTLNGILGIDEISIPLQYILTIIIITGVTNSFNLIDGIDGLVGSISLINFFIIGTFSILFAELGWSTLSFCWSVGLCIFLFYNWKPAKIFMGDGGSLLLGFIMATGVITLLNKSEKLVFEYESVLIISLTSMMILPVSDTLRVMIARIRKGRSPFASDRNHLHHWMLRNNLQHDGATLRILSLHLFLIITSVGMSFILSITTIIIAQLVCITLFTQTIQLSASYNKWKSYVANKEFNH